MSADKLYKRFSRFISQCANTSLSLVKVLILSKRTMKLPGADTDSCIVLGNGPSLRTSLETHPDFFTKHSLVCVNSFSVTDYFEKLKPRYYVMLDPHYWLGEPTEGVIQTLTCIKERTKWEMNLFVPFRASGTSALKDLCASNDFIRVHYFNYTVFKGFERTAFRFYRKNLAMPQSQNVLVAALFLAINNGFRKIYLTGADHTWHQNLHVNEENILCIKDVHFYEQEEKINYRKFFKDEHKVDTFRMHEILATLAKTFYGYEVMSRYAAYCNAKIYNASDVSFIDSFERIKL
jgi:hypothetical protein